MPTVIRPAWTPVNDEQRRLYAEAVRLGEEFRRAEAALWEAIVAARAADVPDVPLCEGAGVSRATLNRRFGPRSGAAQKA